MLVSLSLERLTRRPGSTRWTLPGPSSGADYELAEFVFGMKTGMIQCRDCYIVHLVYTVLLGYIGYMH